jgi:HD-GYP domain-containing protein (c-di-GMP phosphodiesterase class II)
MNMTDATMTLGSFESFDQLVNDRAVCAADKFAALQLSTAVAVEQTLRLTDCTKFRALAEKVGSSVVDLIGAGDVMPRELFRFARHDFNTFTHLTNVAAYSVLLAREVAIHDVAELRKIATGAMLHDIGKRFIPARTLTKTEPLTSEERALVESHPLRGFMELCAQEGLEHGQLMMVYQHHEHVDGTGYPVGILKDEIHPWARILTVVDVFDTMTAKRPDLAAATPENVLHYQLQHAGTRFDGDYVQCWNSAMSKA